ncbi:MAG: hypothetical protein JWN15_146 [Firmicutes bacterium]|nr:hypothetical protein [Bacillota bacterium]
MSEGKADLLEACKHRKMKVTETPANLLEARLKAKGTLDGMDVRIDTNCISGMPGESMGAVTIRGNLAQILSVLARVWPAAPDVSEVVSPGRKSWPDHRPERKKE